MAEARDSQRYTDFAFPPYSYVTGRFPHPLRDADGHGCPGPDESTVMDADQWQTAPMYLWGCDLFNAGFYWEAHEAWESVWHAVGRKGASADFLKGLIKLAAAGVKAREGRRAGVERHATRAIELFSGVAAALEDEHSPTDLSLLVEFAKSIRQRATRITDSSVRDVSAATLGRLPRP